jgi:hypothetical protein
LIGWRDILIERVRSRSLELTEKSVSSIETEGKDALYWIVDEKELISRTIYDLYIDGGGGNDKSRAASFEIHPPLEYHQQQALRSL